MERELKFALTAAGYAKLRALTEQPDALQTNTYFDDEKRSLKRADAGLRIRIEDGKRATFTLKCAVATTASGAKQGWHERREWEARVKPAKARALTAGRARLSSLASPVWKAFDRHLGLERTSLRRLGSLTNRRCALRIGRFHGELDAWSVAGQTFYELEIETSSPQSARRAVARLFAAHSIPVRPRATTKLSTFFRLTAKTSRKKENRRA